MTKSWVNQKNEYISRCNLLRLNHDELKHLSWPLTPVEIESVFISLPLNKQMISGTKASRILINTWRSNTWRSKTSFPYFSTNFSRREHFHFFYKLEKLDENITVKEGMRQYSWWLAYKSISKLNSTAHEKGHLLGCEIYL